MVINKKGGLVRIDPEIKRYAKAEAAIKGMSLKDYCNMKLMSPKIAMDLEKNEKKRFEFRM